MLIAVDMTCCCDSVTAHASLADDPVSTTGNTELLLLTPDTEVTPQNLGPTMILGWGILNPSDLFNQQYPAYWYKQQYRADGINSVLILPGPMQRNYTPLYLGNASDTVLATFDNKMNTNISTHYNSISHLVLWPGSLPSFISPPRISIYSVWHVDSGNDCKFWPNNWPIKPSFTASRIALVHRSLHWYLTLSGFSRRIIEELFLNITDNHCCIIIITLSF